jgi:hypothetical protein
VQLFLEEQKEGKKCSVPGNERGEETEGLLETLSLDRAVTNALHGFVLTATSTAKLPLR